MSQRAAVRTDEQRTATPAVLSPALQKFAAQDRCARRMARFALSVLDFSILT
jgi:hypothetical protein